MHVTERTIDKLLSGSEETLVRVVAGGEGDHVRFLPGVADVASIGRAAAALCNYWGGVILVGVGSDGRLNQVDAEQGQNAIFRARERLLPPIELPARLVAFAGGSVLVVRVPEAKSATSFDGEFFVRVLKGPGEAGPRELALPALPDAASPVEKGRLLVLYTKGQLKLNSMDLAGAVVPPETKLSGARWAGAHLDGAVLSGVGLFRGQLEGAFLRGALMAGVSLEEADVQGADLSGADLRGAGLNSARLHKANLAGANLAGADLSGALLLGTCLRAAKLEGAVLAGAEVDEETQWLAAWTPALFAEAVSRGVRSVNLQRFPAVMRGEILEIERAGLTLTFDSRLHRFDPTAFDALIAEVLGPETDVTIEERSNIDMEGPAFIRINGSRPEDLVAVAEAFYDRAWHGAQAVVEERALQRATSSGTALLLHRLDEMRDRLVKVEASTSLLADDDVREAITDKAGEHILTKRKKSFSTRLQRLVTAIASEVKKRTVDLVFGEGVADTAIDIVGEVVGDARKAIEDAQAARFERKLVEAEDEEDGS